MVRAQYNGGKKYYPGTIKLDNGDNTYTIEYEDGDTEANVKRSLINSGRQKIG